MGDKDSSEEKDKKVEKDTKSDNPEVKKLQDQLDIEKGKRALAEFAASEQLSLVKSQSQLISEILPKTELKAPTGAVTIEGEKLGFFNEQLAYLGMKKVAGEIKNFVQKKLSPADKILISDKLNSAPEDLVYLDVQMQFELHTKILNDQLILVDKLISPSGERFGGPLVALAIAPAFIGAIGNVASFFKTDYTIKGLTVELKNEGLISTVAGDVAELGNEVYILNNYLLGQPYSNTAEEPLAKKLKDLYRTANLLYAKKKQLSASDSEPNREIQAGKKLIKNLEERKKELSADPKGNEKEITAIEKQISDINEVLKSFEERVAEIAKAVQDTDAILASLEKFLKDIATPESSQTDSKLCRAIMREEIRGRGITHLLYLNVISSGGETITGKGFWLNGRFAYVSGVVVNCILTTVDGRIVAADFFPILHRCDFNLKGTENRLSAIPIEIDMQIPR
jgi:hypothetical protein